MYVPQNPAHLHNTTQPPFLPHSEHAACITKTNRLFLVTHDSIALKRHMGEMQYRTLRHVTRIASAVCILNSCFQTAQCTLRDFKFFFTFFTTFLEFTGLLWDINGIYSYGTRHDGPICHCLHRKLVL